MVELVFQYFWPLSGINGLISQFHYQIPAPRCTTGEYSQVVFI